MEVWVTGKKNLDVDLLKRNTKYSETMDPESDLIKNFW